MQINWRKTPYRQLSQASKLSVNGESLGKQRAAADWTEIIYLIFSLAIC
jgi:hypothetical protein